MTPNREIETAWAAGFFDAEGCASCFRNSPQLRMYPTITIGQEHEEVLIRFMRAVGIGKVYGPYYGNGGSKYSYRVRGFSRTAAVMLLLWENLGSIKRNQFDRVLDRFGELP